MDGLKPRRVFLSGGSSTQRAAKPTVGGILALTLRRYGNGGIVRPHRYALGMVILLCRWSRPRRLATSLWRLWPGMIRGLDLDDCIWYNNQGRIQRIE